MNKVDNSGTLEKAHTSNIERLVKEYGAHRHEEIKSAYRKIRSADESKARILDFVPIFCYRKVREALTHK
jgi:hypothetical protein